MGGSLGSAKFLSHSSCAGQISLLTYSEDGAEMKLLCPWVPLSTPSLEASTIKPQPGGRQ